mgnify:FL=1
MASILSIAKKLNKMYDEEICIRGDVIPKVNFMPTGALAADYSLGGGFPKGRIIQISGSPHAGKTTFTFTAIAAYQRENPDSMCVYIDVEHAIDIDFQCAMTHVDREKLIYVSPTRMGAEAIFDMVLEMQEAEDIGMIVIDSVAALASTRQLNADIEKDLGQAGNIAKSLHNFCRQVQDLVYYKKNILVLINQTRTTPLPNGALSFSEPGGTAMGFYPSLSIRCGTRKFINKSGAETTNGEDAIGFKIVFNIFKNKVSNISRGGGYITYKYDTGIDTSSDAIDIAIKAGYINRPTNVTYQIVDLETGEILTVDGTECSFRGKPALVEFFNTHPEFTQEYVKKINNALSGNKEVNLELLDKDVLDELRAEENSVENNNVKDNE